MENKIPTADEFFDVILLKHGASFSDIESDKLYEDIINRAVEFAKLHVKQALEIAAEVPIITKWVHYEEVYESHQDKESIINAYPEDNIK